MRREKILQAALGQFSQHGYAASMGEIAAASGVTRTVLYYYFPAKKDLFIAVFDSLLTRALKAVAPAVAAAESQEERARAVIAALIGFADENPRSWQILFIRDGEPVGELADVVASMEEMARQTVLVLFAADVEELGLDLDSPEAQVMAELLFGGAIQVMRWWASHPDIPRSVVERSVFELVWRGVGGVTRTTRPTL